MSNVWKDGQVVLFVSKAGNSSEKTIQVTGEGFAIVKDAESELIFSPTGFPINETYDELTKGPKIQKRQESNKNNVKNQCDSGCKGCKDYPLCQTYIFDNLLLGEFKELVSIMISSVGQGSKFDLNKFKTSVKIEDKKKLDGLFDRVKGRLNKSNKKHSNKHGRNKRHDTIDPKV